MEVLISRLDIQQQRIEGLSSEKDSQVNIIEEKGELSR